MKKKTGPRLSPGRRKKPAVFLDRDGTILNETGYLGDPEKMKFYSDAFRGLRLLSKRKIPLIVVSNQSGIGRRYFSRRDFTRVNRAFLKTLRRHGVHITGVYICPHKPSVGCSCRKPRIGLLRRAARRHHLDLRRSFVVGDQDRDLLMARRAQASGVLVLTGKGKYYRSRAAKLDSQVVSKLSIAARWILKRLKGKKWDR